MLIQQQTQCKTTKKDFTIFAIIVYVFLLAIIALGIYIQEDSQEIINKDEYLIVGIPNTYVISFAIYTIIYIFSTAIYSAYYIIEYSSNDNLIEELKEITENIKKSKDEFEKLTQQIKDEQNKLDAINANIATQKSELAIINQQIQDAKGKLPESGVLSQNSEKIQELNKQITKLESDKSSLEDQTSLTNQIQVLNTSAATNEQINKDLKAKITELDQLQNPTSVNEITELKQQITQLNEAIKTENDNRTKAQNELNALKAQLASGSSADTEQINQLQIDIKQIQGELQSSKETNNQLETNKNTEINRLNTEIETKQNEIENLRKQLTTTQSAIDATNGERSELTTQISTLKNEISNLKNQIKEPKEQTESSDGTISNEDTIEKISKIYDNIKIPDLTKSQYIGGIISGLTKTKDIETRSLNKKLETLNKQLESSGEKLESSKKTIDQKNHMIDQLRIKNAELENKTYQLTETLKQQPNTSQTQGIQAPQPNDLLHEMLAIAGPVISRKLNDKDEVIGASKYANNPIEAIEKQMQRKIESYTMLLDHQAHYGKTHNETDYYPAKGDFFHNHIDNKDNLLIVVKYKSIQSNDIKYLVGFSQQTYCSNKNQEANKNNKDKIGLLFSVNAYKDETIIAKLKTKKEQYEYESYMNAMTYDEYFINFGNSDIRMKHNPVTNKLELYSNYGTQTSSYKEVFGLPGDNNIETLQRNNNKQDLGDFRNFINQEQNERNLDLLDFQIYQLKF